MELCASERKEISAVRWTIGLLRSFRQVVLRTQTKVEKKEMDSIWVNYRARIDRNWYIVRCQELDILVRGNSGSTYF